MFKNIPTKKTFPIFRVYFELAGSVSKMDGAFQFYFKFVLFSFLQENCSDHETVVKTLGLE